MQALSQLSYGPVRLGAGCLYRAPLGIKCGVLVAVVALAVFFVRVVLDFEIVVFELVVLVDDG
jgi:hypothetical protein